LASVHLECELVKALAPCSVQYIVQDSLSHLRNTFHQSATVLYVRLINASLSNLGYPRYLAKSPLVTLHLKHRTVYSSK